MEERTQKIDSSDSTAQSGSTLSNGLQPSLRTQFKLEFQSGLQTGLRFFGILSSHPSKNSFRSARWQHALACAIQKAKMESAVILYPNRAPYADAIAFACEQLNARAYAVQYSPTEFHPAVAPADRSSAAVLYAFPHQDTYSERYSVPDQSMNDWVVCALSHRVFSLGLRPGGKSAKLLELRLADPEIDPSSLWLATDSTLPRNVLDLQRRFNARGAVLWFPVLPKAIEIPPLGCRLRSIPPTLQITGKLPRGLIESTDYFIHCTRSREGKWPDQDDRAFLAESFRLAFEYNPSPLNTLLRIVRTQRLIGTSARKRGGLPSISFTANPLGEILSRREFQHHLAHWDWEPFGIAISKERLIHMGARQVQYVTKSTMNALSIDEQRFCQPAKEAENGRDWSSEEEWRLPGDLRLSKLTPSDAFLFVGDRTSAKLLAHYSRWPVFWL